MAQKKLFYTLPHYPVPEISHFAYYINKDLTNFFPESH